MPLLSHSARRRRDRSTKSRPRSQKLQRSAKALSCEVLEQRRMLATFVVSNLDSSGFGSLSDAIDQANAAPTDDTILFQQALAGGQISIGTLDITDDVEIFGTVNDPITLQSNSASQAFYISDGSAQLIDVAISRLNLEKTVGGSPAQLNGGMIRNKESLELVDVTISGANTDGRGGAIDHAYGSLQLQDVTLTNNRAGGRGGAISSTSGNVTIRDSMLSGNESNSVVLNERAGGAVYHAGNGTLFIEDSVISGNTAYGDGGGLHVRGGLMTISRTRIEDNVATGPVSDGGAFYSRAATINVINSSLTSNYAQDDGAAYVSAGGGVFENTTVSSNQVADDGGGIVAVSAADLSIEHSTITRNTADVDKGGGGVAGGLLAGTNITMTVENSIVADNFNGAARDDLGTQGTFAVSHSLVGAVVASNVNSAGGNLLGSINAPIDPLLGPLSLNPATTRFHGLRPGSPAIDTGDPNIPSFPSFDQRNGQPFFRRNGVIDMGSIEYQPQTWTVDVLADFVDGDFSTGDLSLREALFLTGGAEPDTIEFASGLTGKTILLTQGELDATGAVEIIGLGADLLTIDAQSNSRIFNVDDGSDFDHSHVAISGLTLTGGSAPGLNEAGDGGAIRSLENLTVTDATVIGNEVRNRGAGIFASTDDVGTEIRIERSTVTGNTNLFDGDGAGLFVRTAGFGYVADSLIRDNNSPGFNGSGGGIYAVADNGTIFITRTNVENNYAGNSAGGIFASANGYGAVSIANSTISGNFAEINSGGGLLVSTADSGLGILSNSTVSGNGAALNGGGVLVGYASDFRAYNSTVASNVADFAINGSGDGGGIGLALNSKLRLENTIVASNFNFGGGATDIGTIGTGVSIVSEFSLIGDNTGSSLTEANPDLAGNIIGGPMGGAIDPQLGSLADHGGPTRTRALASDSPAIDAGDPSFSGAGQFDQRGAPFNRVQSGRIDMGAFERFDVTSLVVDTLVDESDQDFSAGDLSLREALELTNGEPSPSRITFDSSLSGGTIVLTHGQLEITDSVDLSAAGLSQITIDASGNDPTPGNDNGDGTRVLSIDDGDFSAPKSVVLENLILTGGDEFGSSGGIYSTENLELTDVTITDNAAADSGGIFARIPFDGVGTFHNLTISHNRAIDRPASGLDPSVGGAAIGGFGGSTIDIQNVDIHDNTSVSFDGGLQLFTSAGVVNASDITIIDNEVTGFDERRGAGTFLSTTGGQITVERAIISGNQASGGIGGASLAASGGSISLLDSEVSGNGAFGDGGGLYLFSELNAGIDIRRTTIANNVTTGSGGGLFIKTNPDGLSPLIENSTISDNVSGGQGGGIAGTGDAGGPAIALVRHSTIVGNSASHSGGGIYNQDGTVTTLVLDHSIVADNEHVTGDGVDITVGVVPFFSLIGDNEGASAALVEAPVGSPDANGNLIGGATGGVIDPKLGPLQDNGGATPTHALLNGSPAINAGDPALVPGKSAPSTDQRSLDRIRLGAIDMGAFELQDQIIDPDFNDDGNIDGVDIDLLQANIVTGPADPGMFDLNGDGAVTIADRDAWLVQAGAANLPSGNPYLLGDANLDGTVDGQDFLSWNTNKFTNSSDWTGGDFNADGTVDGQDFLLWNTNKFQSSDRLSTGNFVRANRYADSKPTSHGDEQNALFDSIYAELEIYRDPMAPSTASHS